MLNSWEEAMSYAEVELKEEPLEEPKKKKSQAAKKQNFFQTIRSKVEERKLQRELGNFYHEKAFMAKYKEVQDYLLKKSGKAGYFDPLEIIPLDTLYFMVCGERSNGKTFAVLVICLIRYILYGEKFTYLRRWDLDLTPRRLDTLFGSLQKFQLVEFITDGEYDFIAVYQRAFYLGRNPRDEDEAEVANAKLGGIPYIREPEPFGYAFALSMMEHDKGGNQPVDITTIIFDEFMSRQRYLIDELALFSNCISSIKRDDGRFKVWMLGNTVTTYCPYFREMGLKHIKEMKKGEIQTYQGSDPSTTIAVQWADSPDKDAKSEINKFFAFDNPKLKMITEGSFETADYPKFPNLGDSKKDYEIVFRFFLDFDNDLLQADVYASDSEDSEFIFWHPKTTPLKDEDDDLIYSEKVVYKSNYRRSFKNPQTTEEAAIRNLIALEKMFFADNQCGETLRNFMLNATPIIS